MCTSGFVRVRCRGKWRSHLGDVSNVHWDAPALLVDAGSEPVHDVHDVMVVIPAGSRWPDRLLPHSEL